MSQNLQNDNTASPELSQTHIAEQPAKASQETANDLDLSLFNFSPPSPPEGSNTEEIFAAIDKIRQGIPAALKFLAEGGAQLEAISDRVKRRAAKIIWEKRADEASGYLEHALDKSLPDHLRAAAAMAYLNYRFSQEFKNPVEANDILSDLEARGLLIKQEGQGPILIGYQHYSLGQFGLEPEDQEEVQGKIAEFCRRQMQAVKEERRRQGLEMEAKANIDIAGLLGKKVGRCFLEIPAESFEKRDGSQGWRGGGQILVEATEKDIIPISATGSIEKVVQGMVERRVVLQRHTLTWDTPPGCNQKTFDRMMEAVMNRSDLTAEEAEKWINSVKALWYLIHRGIDAISAKEKAKEEFKQFEKEADISACQFFGLNGSAGNTQSGTALLSFDGNFKRDGKPSVASPFVLVRRSDEGENTIVEVVKIPRHAYEFLKEHVGKKYAEGKDFNGCPANLGRLLRAIRGQEELAAVLNKS